MEVIRSRATARAPRRVTERVTRMLELRTESADMCMWILIIFLGSQVVEAVWELSTRADYVLPGSCNENRCGGCV